MNPDKVFPETDSPAQQTPEPVPAEPEPPRPAYTGHLRTVSLSDSPSQEEIDRALGF